MKTNEGLCEEAKEAINTVFSDTRVSKQEAVENLNGLADDIDILIEALRMEMQQEDEN